MQANGGSDHHRWWYRHALLTVGACGAIGTALGYAVAASLPEAPESRIWVELLQPAASVAALMAGILLGVLAGFLLMGAGGRGIRCPRCGTLNDTHAVTCSGCSLSLR